MRPRTPPRPKQSSGCRGLAVGCGIAFAALTLFCTAGMFFAWRSQEDARKEMEEAGRLWDTGKKADAVAKYKSLLDRDRSDIPGDAERPTVYQRVIEYESEQGNADVAKRYAEKALDKQVDLSAGNKATAGLVAQVRADRERREAEERARREAEEKRRQDEREAEAKRREEERKNAPQMSVEIVKIRLQPFRTAQGLQTHMVCVDWKNTGNRPVRWLTAKIKAFDSRDREIDAIPLSEIGIYAAPSNNGPGIPPGETYATPDDRGRMIPPLLDPQVKRVTVQIVKVEEKGPE